jgi:hypothetical protein
VQNRPNEHDSRVRPLDESVERLTSDVASLKLELATLVSALREVQYQQAGYRTPLRVKALPSEAPNRPSMVPAAIVVLLAAALLSWQVIVTPPPGQAQASRPMPADATRAADDRGPAPLTAASEAASRSTDPPPTPLVRPTIYKGTLTVNADRPGATVFVNRQSVGTAPVRLRNLRAGAHLVWVESEGYRRWTRVVTVPAERVTRVSADLEPLDAVER